MQRYKFSELTYQTIKNIAEFEENPTNAFWQPAVSELTDDEKKDISNLKVKLKNLALKKMNEATVWGKAIFPLLMQAEDENSIAEAQVETRANFKLFILEGFVDGVIGKQKAGYLALPYLVVIEAKREMEAKDPQPQLYGAMLAAAKLNFDEEKKEPEIIFGCHTIGDSWTFMRGEVSDIDSEKPNLKVQASREFIERFEAEIILGILKAIVADNEKN